MGVFDIFKKSEIDPIESEIKKYPKKRQKKLRELLQDYNNGKVLHPNENIDNKELILSKS